MEKNKKTGEKAKPPAAKKISTQRIVATLKKLGFSMDDVIAQKDYGDYVVIVTNEGRKIRIEA